MLCFEFEYLLPIVPYGHGIFSRRGGVGENCFLVGLNPRFLENRLSVLFSQFAYEQDDNNTGSVCHSFIPFSVYNKNTISPLNF